MYVHGLVHPPPPTHTHATYVHTCMYVHTVHTFICTYTHASYVHVYTTRTCQHMCTFIYLFVCYVHTSTHTRTPLQKLSVSVSPAYDKGGLHPCASHCSIPHTTHCAPTRTEQDSRVLATEFDWPKPSHLLTKHTTHLYRNKQTIIRAKI